MGRWVLRWRGLHRGWRLSWQADDRDVHRAGEHLRTARDIDASGARLGRRQAARPADAHEFLVEAASICLVREVLRRYPVRDRAPLDLAWTRKTRTGACCLAALPRTKAGRIREP